jgi:hypothetical protein
MNQEAKLAIYQDDGINLNKIEQFNISKIVVDIIKKNANIFLEKFSVRIKSDNREDLLLSVAYQNETNYAMLISKWDDKKL